MQEVEETVILYLLLKMVYILCRFHVDKISSAHVYLRLHKVNALKHGSMALSLVMSSVACSFSEIKLLQVIMFKSVKVSK